MTTPVQRHQDILQNGAAFHMVRATLPTAQPKTLHGQSYYEMIWVQNGVLRHHTPAGHQDLPEGSVVFIRPDDQHALQGRAEQPMVVSLCLHPTLMRRLGNRHEFDRFFWSEAVSPTVIHLDVKQLSQLNRAALRLERAERSSLEAEAFLLPVLAQITADTPLLPPEAPDWLLRACTKAHEPEIYREGAAGFVRIAGRAHPHVSRTTKRFLGQSPSDYINKIRMEVAARQLCSSTASLEEIAQNVGLSNLSHFHRLFRDHTGTPPSRYRRMHQRDVIAPGPAQGA